jgi:hypothetical protein
MSESDETGGQTEGQCAPWTIKNFPSDVKAKAAKSAQAAGVTQAEWVTAAVILLADRQSRDGLIPPPAPGRPEADPLPLTVDLAGLAAAVSAVANAAELSGARVPKSLARNLAAVCNRTMERALGRPPRRTGGQTIAGKRQILTIGSDT